MTVRIVTDSSACIPDEFVEALDITVVPLHVINDGDDSSTAGLTALELTAVYARQLERGNDDGVVAVHLAKELSSTWTAANTAAAVFDEGAVRVVETDSVGMAIGEAAIAAARAARAGASVEECARIAGRVKGHNHLWLYVHRPDALRRSGRMSTGASLLSAALPVKPIFELTRGEFVIAARTRTQSKALVRLVELVIEAVGSRRAFVAVHLPVCDDSELDPGIARISEYLRDRLPAGSKVVDTTMGDTLAIHTGSGAVAVSVFFPDDAEEDDLAPKSAAEGALTQSSAEPVDKPE